MGPSLSPSETTFQWLARPSAFLDECAASYGDTFALRFTRFGTHVVVAHPDDVRAVMSGDPDVLYAGRGNRLLEPILGRYSLLVADGDEHAAQRSLLQSAFRGDPVQGYARVVAAATRLRTASWQSGRTIKLQRTALEISRDVILRVVLGVTDDEIDRYGALIDAVMAVVGTNATFDGSSEQAPLSARLLAARRALHEALQEQIDRRRSGSAGGDDVLGVLVAARDGSGARLSDEAIRDQLTTMILAGHETTASSITWAMLCLHAEPRALQAVLRELEDAGADPPAHKLAELPYLRAVCFETLRMRPVIPVVSREVQRPFRLGDLTLLPGVFVTACAYLAQRRPESFPEPESFRPERFLDRRPSPYVYFPFGGGARRCIGMSFALLELQVVLGMLLGAFRFAPANGAVRPVRRAVTVVASGGGKMYVEPRVAS